MLNQDSVVIIGTEWNGVELMLERMKKITVGSFGSLGGIGVGKVVYNLPLLLATDVLCQTLLLAKKQSLFESRNRTLGALVKDSKDSLPWLDWESIMGIVTKRNEIAHDGELFEGKLCVNAIEAIKQQLQSWQLL
jgi:hypothetical protein